jgi:peptidoglycan/LPS O-acetylase OafA/YrhL
MLRRPSRKSGGGCHALAEAPSAFEFGCAVVAARIGASTLFDRNGPLTSERLERRFCLGGFMRSSEGLYFERVDHLRAVAVFLVFFWHVAHDAEHLRTVPPDYAPPRPFFLFSLLEEGHLGVALFMTLSGYLFAKIVGNHGLIYHRFLINRALRLFPLLGLLMLVWAAGGRMSWSDFWLGFIREGWPIPGSWSVMIEVQFYVMFPLFLLIPRTYRVAALAVIVLSTVAIRCAVWVVNDEVQSIAAWSLLGYADSLLIGMALAYSEGRLLTLRYARALATSGFLVFCAVWHWFNESLGFYGNFPSRSPFWVVLPTLQALGCAAAIFAYCNGRFAINERINLILRRVGEASYSIYLLHLGFISSTMSVLASAGVAQLSLGLVSALCLPLFVVTYLVARLAYERIEKPFLQHRLPYVVRAHLDSSPATILPRVSGSASATNA